MAGQFWSARCWIAVAVLGYLYWDSRNNTIFKAPGVEIKKN